MKVVLIHDTVLYRSEVPSFPWRTARATPPRWRWRGARERFRPIAARGRVGDCRGCAGSAARRRRQRGDEAERARERPMLAVDVMKNATRYAVAFAESSSTTAGSTDKIPLGLATPCEGLWRRTTARASPRVRVPFAFPFPFPPHTTSARLKRTTIRARRPLERVAEAPIRRH